MVERIQLYGERHSGTSWLKELINKNYDIDPKLNHIGHKHWFPNIWKLDILDLSTTLFLFITRDPYNWCEAMYRKTHHCHPSLEELSLDELVRSEWHCVMNPSEKYKSINKEMYKERNPATLKRFNNMLELRTEKHSRFFAIKRIAPYFTHIKYEDLTKSFEDIITNIASKYKIPLKHNSIQGYTYGNSERNLPRKTIKFINENLNWEVEKLVGYERHRTH